MFPLPIAIVVVFIAAFSASAQPQTMSDKTALEFLSDIRFGWNLGNTLDAVNGSTATEGVWSWGGPGAATQALFTGVAQSGFDAVRIPVTWTGHIGDAPNYTVSTERLQRVKEIIGYAKTAGAKAIIINVHHDGHAFDHNSWLRLSEAVNSEQTKANLQDKLAKVWTQIANYFKDYGDYLIFETLNEVHIGSDGIGAWGGYWMTTKNNPEYQKQQDILFDWNSVALKAIRETGGNNATRYVAVPGLGGTEPNIVNAAHERGKLLPNDGTNGTSKLIVSVHYYAPSKYTVEDNEPKDADKKVHTWGTAAELKALSDDVGSLKTNYTSKGIAVYFGEWGGPTDLRKSMSDDIKSTHINYLKSVAETARQNNVLTFLWDDGGHFKLLERSSGKPAAGFATEVLNAILPSSSAGGSSSSVYSSSSSEESTPIAAHTPYPIPHTPAYYTLKGEPAGSAKPATPGVYVVKQGSSVRKIVVK